MSTDEERAMTTDEIRLLPKAERQRIIRLQRYTRRSAYGWAPRYYGPPDGLKFTKHAHTVARKRARKKKIHLWVKNLGKHVPIVAEVDDYVSFIGPQGTRLIGDVVSAYPARDSYQVVVDGTRYAVVSIKDEMRREKDDRR